MDERHGFPGTLRTLGGSRGVTASPGIEGRHGFAGNRGASRLRRDAPSVWGVWGAISWPPISNRRDELEVGLVAQARARACATSPTSSSSRLFDMGGHEMAPQTPQTLGT